jgi:ribosomal protein S18 acetylase RimI-like enzyme
MKHPAPEEAPTDRPIFEVKRLRRPPPALLDELAAYDREAFGDTSLRSWDLNVIAHAGALFAGLLGQQIVACCQLIRTYDEPAALWVFGFWVRPAWQSQGLGRDLLVSVAREVASAGADTLLLSADPRNRAALALYSSFGFREVEQVRDFYGPGEDRLLMRWQAGPRAGQ